MQARRLLSVLIVLAVLVTVIVQLWILKPPGTVTVVTGPLQGSFHEYAMSYRKGLESVVDRIDVQPEPQSLNIPGRIDQGSGGQFIGFAAVNNSAREYSNVQSVGVVDVQPLFIFVRQGKAGVSELLGLKGGRVIMPPKGSASAQAALALLELHGLAEGDVTVVHRPLAEVAEALRRQEFDAGFMMLSASHPTIVELFKHPGLSLLDLPRHEVIARRLDFLVPITVPQGLFDLGANSPAQDLRLVGAPIDVLVHKDLHPAVVQALLVELTNKHGGQSLLARRGTYPDMKESQWPVHPAAKDYAREGTPWMYERLYPWLAAVVDVHWPFILLIIALAALYDGVDNIVGLLRTTRHVAALAILHAIQRRREAHPERAPSWKQQRLQSLAEQLLRDDSAAQKAQALLAKTQGRQPPTS